MRAVGEENVGGALTFSGGEGEMHSALYECQTSLLHLRDDTIGLVFDVAFWRDIESEDGAALVGFPFETLFVLLVDAEEDELGDGDGGVVVGEQLIFGLLVRILANERLDIGVGCVCEL